MPRKLEIDALQAEQAGLRALLAEATAIDDPVGELQYTHRLEEIQKHLVRLRDSHVPMASVALFFSGKPVLGSLGIASDFASKALGDYQELISKTFAESELGRMGQRGPIPLRQEATLMVTGLAHGSFGFVLNELSDQTELHDTALKEAVKETSTLLECVSASNETEFEQATDDLDPRTLNALKRFFKDLDNEGASIRIVDDYRELNLNDEAIHRARVRTEATEIDELPLEMEGILKGFLPDHRRFEMHGLDGQTYYGPASREATEQFQNEIARGHAVIGKPCVVGLITRTVRSLDRMPRLAYRLSKFYSIGENVSGKSPRS